MVEASASRRSRSPSASTHRRFDEVGARRDRRAASRLRVPRADGASPQRRGAAAEARVALRRAVRGLLGRADLLRVEGGAPARHGGAVGRRRRRAVGRLHAPPRRALGTARARRARVGGAASPDWLGQALPLSVKGARSLRHLALDARPGLRAQTRLRACSNRTPRASSTRATSAAGVQRLRRARDVSATRITPAPRRSARPLDVRRRRRLT